MIGNYWDKKIQKFIKKKKKKKNEDYEKEKNDYIIGM